MPRSLTSIVKAELMAQQTGSAFFFLIALSHPNLVETLRFVRNNEAVVRLGFTWNPTFFEISLPDEGEDSIPRVTLAIENIDRTLSDSLRRLETPMTVDLYVATSADDTMVIGPFTFTWRDTSFDARIINASLEAEDILNQTYPRHRFVPSQFPGLFR